MKQDSFGQRAPQIAAKPRSALLTAEQFPALRLVASAPRVGRVARGLALLLMLCACALVLVPWQQTAPGTGRVVALSPEDRVQAIEAPITGRVVRWGFKEGDQVRAGDVIVELRDNDPELLDRLGSDLANQEAQLEAARLRIDAYEDKLGATREAAAAARSGALAKVEAARQKLLAEQDGLLGEEAALEAATLNLNRIEDLANQGLKSAAEREAAVLREQTARAKASHARAKVSEARANLRSAEEELEKVVQEAQAKINAVESELQDAFTKEAVSRSKVLSTDSKLSRQRSQQVLAPRDGTLQKLSGGQGGEQVKSGEVLATLVPDQGPLAVELKVSGNDAPLLQAGQRVRLQLEGWPAIQFAGWPGVAVGTFGGRITFVDAADDGQGKFRMMVVPDPEDAPWPERPILRQGVRAQGWVLLSVVPLGFELWRQLNGFPASVDGPDVKTDPKKGAKKEDEKSKGALDGEVEAADE